MASQYYQEYQKAMTGADSSFPITQPSQQLMQDYRVEGIPPEELEKLEDKFDIRLIYVGCRASIAIYYVDLGRFRFTINLLNLPGQAPSPSESVGKGSFGTVLRKTVAEQVFVAKIIEFKDGLTVQDVICEVAISKLCAMHRIGPDIETTIPFDIILYEDAAQFHLELCTTVQARLDSKEVNIHNELLKLGRQIKECLNILHKLHVTHRDIKPENFLWCHRLQRYVLCDFGLAQYLKEEIGRMSKTDCVGTPKYMGPEMRKLFDDKKKNLAMVDLYYNDVHGWKEAFRVIAAHNGTTLQISSPVLEVQNNQPQCSGNEQIPDPSKQKELSSLHFMSTQSCKSTFPQTHPEQSEPNQAYKKPDSYEFYRLVYAAIFPNYHKFQLKENLPKLNQEQANFIYSIFKESLDKQKMQFFLDELRSVEKGELWEHWIGDLQQAYIDNFPEHHPRAAPIPTLDRAWIQDLMRLLGRTPKLLQIDKQLTKPQGRLTSNTMLQDTTREVREKRLSKIVECMNEVLKHSLIYFLISSVDVDSMKTFYAKATLDPRSHTSKLFLARYFLTLFQTLERAPLTIEREDRHTLEVLIAILTKQNAVQFLAQYLQAQKCFEKRLFMTSLHVTVSKDNSDTFLNLCMSLLQGMELSKEKCSDILYVKRLIFQIQLTRIDRGVDAKIVRKHFEECVALFPHLSLENTHVKVVILKDRLRSFQQFQFPLSDMRNAHIEYEKLRSFYSEVEVLQSNLLVRNTYTNQQVEHSQSGLNKYLATQVQLKLKSQELALRGHYRSALKILREIDDAGAQTEEAGTERNMSLITFEVYLLMSLGKVTEAESLHKTLTSRLFKEINLCEHIVYYQTQAMLLTKKGQYDKAFDSCNRALQINNRLEDSQQTMHTKHELNRLRAQLLSHFGRQQQSLEILAELRTAILARNDLRLKNRYLVGNYGTTADVLRSIRQYSQSRNYCQKLLGLKDVVSAPDTIPAHLVMLRIAQQLEQMREAVEQSWSLIDKTTVLGDEPSCVAYTCLMHYYRPKIGNEVMSLISYARRQTDKPIERYRGKEIAEELYEDNIAAGRLPLDMLVQDFVRQAELRLEGLTVEQHTDCFEFKLRLAQAMQSKCADQPQFNLHAVRTTAEAYLHLFLAGRFEQTKAELPSAIQGMMAQTVGNRGQQQQQQILCLFARSVLFKCRNRLWLPPMRFSIAEQSLVEQLANSPTLTQEDQAN